MEHRQCLGCGKETSRKILNNLAFCEDCVPEPVLSEELQTAAKAAGRAIALEMDKVINEQINLWKLSGSNAKTGRRVYRHGIN